MKVQYRLFQIVDLLVGEDGLRPIRQDGTPFLKCVEISEISNHGDKDKPVYEVSVPRALLEYKTCIPGSYIIYPLSKHFKPFLAPQYFSPDVVNTVMQGMLHENTQKLIQRLEDLTEVFMDYTPHETRKGRGDMHLGYGKLEEARRHFYEAFQKQELQTVWVSGDVNPMAYIVNDIELPVLCCWT